VELAGIPVCRRIGNPQVRIAVGETLWSWRESNPRPNNESKSFLHAYFVIKFQLKAGHKHPTFNLSLFISPLNQGVLMAISEL